MIIYIEHLLNLIIIYQEHHLVCAVSLYHELQCYVIFVATYYHVLRSESYETVRKATINDKKNWR